MHKKLLMQALLFICCMHATQTISMECDTFTQESLNNIRLVTNDLQTHILLKQENAPCKKIIRFLLSRQSTTITIPQHWMSNVLDLSKPYPSIKIQDNNATIKSYCLLNGWTILTYNINDSACINKTERERKNWEAEKLTAKINKNRAVRVIFKHQGFELRNKTGLWDTQTGKQIFVMEYEDNIDLLTTHNEEAILLLSNQKLIAWDTQTNTTRTILQNRNTYNKHYISAITANDNSLIIGTCDGLLEMWDLANDKLLHTFPDHITKITAIKIVNNILLTGARNGTTHIWRINTDELSGHTFKLLRILTGPDCHDTALYSFAIQNHTVATASKDGTVKIWSLKKNLEQLPEADPLAWLAHTTDALQLNFIWHAYRATQADQEFVLDLPDDFKIVDNDETAEQTYGRIFLTFPQEMRAYFSRYLNIRKLKSVLKANQEACAIM